MVKIKINTKALEQNIKRFGAEFHEVVKADRTSVAKEFIHWSLYGSKYSRSAPHIRTNILRESAAVHLGRSLLKTGAEMPILPIESLQERDEDDNAEKNVIPKTLSGVNPYTISLSYNTKYAEEKETESARLGWRSREAAEKFGLRIGSHFLTRSLMQHKTPLYSSLRQALKKFLR